MEIISILDNLPNNSVLLRSVACVRLLSTRLSIQYSPDINLQINGIIYLALRDKTTFF